MSESLQPTVEEFMGPQVMWGHSEVDVHLQYSASFLEDLRIAGLALDPKILNGDETAEIVGQVVGELYRNDPMFAINVCGVKDASTERYHTALKRAVEAVVPDDLLVVDVPDGKTFPHL